jgi:Raf kinase inhibitor-like YbhB/YbcL family protein
MALVAMATALAWAGGCGSDSEEGGGPSGEIELSSPAFEDGAAIPEPYTCDGEDLAPPLAWARIPDEAAEVAIVMQDLDSPGSGGFLHWAMFGLVVDDATRLPAGFLPAGAKRVKNGFGDTTYGGPCPPLGDDPHRYELTLYALGRRLNLEDGAGGDDALAAIRKETIATGKLTGTYGR